MSTGNNSPISGKKKQLKKTDHKNNVRLMC